MNWLRIVITVFSISFLLLGCREEEPKVDCDEIAIANKVCFSLNNLDFIPSKCIMEITNNDFDYLSVMGCEYICLNPNEYNVKIGFGDDNEGLFSSNSEYHIKLNDSLHFYIDAIKIKTDTIGKDEKGNWIIDCVIDSYTVNHERISSKFPDLLYIPMSLGTGSRKRK